MQLKAALRGHDYATQVQMLKADGPLDRGMRVHSAAEKGISGSSGTLPHASTIQKSFGGYDISNIQAHLDPAAHAGATAMGAQAYATGNHVAFATGGASLHTAAHEATHVIQQQAGVSLSGGVGKAGDVSEKHADDVADLVVQGKSAEGLLGEMAGGGGGSGSDVVQKQEPPRGAVDTEAQKEERALLTLEGGGVDYEAEIGLSFDNIATHRNAIYRNQMEACATLAETAGKKDPPSLLQDAITFAVEIALVAATAGIGASVALGVISKLTSLAVDAKGAESVIKIVSEVAKDSTKAVIKKIGQAAPGKVSVAMSEYPESDPERTAKICFMSQRSVLIDAAHDAELSYNLGKALLKGTGETGLKASKALESSLSAQVEPAREVQRTKSIQEWANYQARAGRKTTKGDNERVDMNGPGDRGVLKLEGTWFSGDTPILTSASMAGMNDAVRPEIAKTAIRDLHIPIEVELEIGEDLNMFEELLVERGQQKVRFSRDNKGLVWVALKGQEDGLVSLAKQTRTPTQKYLDANGRAREDVADHILTARAAFDRMAALKPPLK